MSDPKVAERLRKQLRLKRIGKIIGRVYGFTGLAITLSLPFLLESHGWSVAAAFFILWYGGLLFVVAAFLAPMSVRETPRMRQRRVEDVLDHAAERYARLFRQALESGKPEAFLNRKMKPFYAHYTLLSSIRRLMIAIAVFYVLLTLIVAAAVFLAGLNLGWNATLLECGLFAFDAVSKGLFLDILEGLYPVDWSQKYGIIGQGLALAIRSVANVLVFLAAARLLLDWQVTRDVSFARKISPSEAAFQKEVNERIIHRIREDAKALPNEQLRGLEQVARSQFLPRIFKEPAVRSA